MIIGVFPGAICCQNARLNKEQLLRYIGKSSALTQEADINGIKVTLQYEPSDLLVEQALGSGGKRDPGNGGQSDPGSGRQSDPGGGRKSDPGSGGMRDMPKDTARIRALENKYDGQYYFKLSYSRAGKEVIRQLGSYDRYSDMLQVMSFEMGKYITAITDTHDTLALADYLFNQEYGMTNANHLVLVFKKQDLEKAKNFAITIEEFGLGIGITQFEFKKEDLDRTPRLADL